MSQPETFTVDVPQTASKIVSTVKTHAPETTVISKTYVRLPLTTCKDTTGADEKTKKEAANYKQYDTSVIKQDFKPTLPTIDAKAEVFVPMPYMFRVPAWNTKGNVTQRTTKCPPFYIQLDHAIAVVWSLFSHEEYQKPLGINQLQWAYAFLDTVKDSKGRHSPDVTYCLEVISDELITQYAELADDVQKLKDSQARTHPKCSTMVKEPSKADSLKEPSNTDTLKEDSDTTWKTASASTLKNEKSTVMVKKEVPFSINYADMITRTPSNTNNFDSSKSCKSCSAIEPETSGSKSNMLSFLSEWRKDQVKKIHMELDRLHSIETYIGNANSGVEPYMDEKDKEMHVLLGEKMKRAAM